MPAAPTFDPLRDGDRTLATFRAPRALTRPDQLRPCWPLQGAAPVAVTPLAPMERVLAGRAELWVVQLPAQMDADALDGCVLQLDEAMAGAAERAGDMGSLEIAASAAEELGLVRRYALRQEAAGPREPLFVAAPTGRGRGSLEVLRPARRVVVAEDVPAANDALVGAAHGAAPELQLYPGAMPAERGNRLLQKEGIFKPPPAEPPAGTWPPTGWAPGPLLQERDKRRAARRRRGVPEVEPGDDLEQARLIDLRPAAGAPWGEAGGGPPLGDVEQDVSVAYRYA
ncbi:MAG: hypothetical protein J3K34DRAFT_413362 [Monoraphidium minutum]|nr:MAG: hypothetical protein J3K34DRAFT_413362 [Monoraphidium minutum]